jgi:DNA-binding NtrC family response regulator
MDPGQIVEAKPATHNGVYIPPGGRRLEEIEREAILGTLSRFNGHRLRTAKALGIGVRTLGLKLKKWKEMQLIDPSV